MSNSTTTAWCLPADERMRLLRELLPSVDVFNLYGVQDIGMRVLNRAGYVVPAMGVKLFIRGSRNHAAQYDSRTMEIEVSSVHTPSGLLVAVCHELAHHVQHVLYGQYFQPGSFDDLLAYELEACRFSYRVYRVYFDDIIEKLRETSFRAYRSHSQLQHLQETWDAIEEGRKDNGNVHIRNAARSS